MMQLYRCTSDHIFLIVSLAECPYLAVPLKYLFEFLLATPVQFWCAQSMYRGMPRLVPP